MRKTRLLTRAAALLLALIVAVPAFSALASAEAVYTDSGYKSLPKLTPYDIWKLVNETPLYWLEEQKVFDVNPSIKAPYSAGKVKDQVLNDVTERLNMLRRLAGIDPVTADPALCESAQYGAVLMAASEFSHTPAKPADMDEAFYKKGYSATSSGNIYMGKYLMGTPAGFMEDSDPTNIDSLGHRRWQLNPSLGKVGFGFAYRNGRPFTAEKIFDRSAEVKDYDFISWPSSGHFPTGEWFEEETAWSVTLNPGKYLKPDRSQVKVTLTKTATGQKWSFSAASSNGYFNVENSSYGVSNCIIFRPESVGEYKGEYSVTVTGLNDRDGGSASVSFRVSFFDCDSALTEDHRYAASVVTPTCTKRGYTSHTCYLCGFGYANNYVDALGHDFGPDWKAEKCLRCGADNNTVAGFKDVTTDDFFADPVAWAVEKKITAGTGKNTFSPEEGCTRGQVVTFLWRAAGEPEPVGSDNPFRDVKEGEYYYKAVLWAVEKGITTGTGKNTFSPNEICTRGQIVTFLWRSAGQPEPSEKSNPFSDVKSEDYFYKSVLWAVEKKITLGTDADHFSPSDTCTRGQVVTFLFRDMG